MYIDEVGNHDLTHVEDPNHRFLSLTGVIVESGYALHTLGPEMEALKRCFFQHDPDEPVVFHRKDMVNRRPPFQSLRNPITQAQFDSELLAALGRWEYGVVTVVLDKQAHRDRYTVWRYDAYHYCLAVTLERFVMYLARKGHRGDVMVESRGRKEDQRLMASYGRLHQEGNEWLPADSWQTCLTSKELKCRPKSANVAGLQLADLLAHPSQREVLLDHRLIDDARMTFGTQICKIMRKNKYQRNPRTGQIEGYGKKLLP
jgi:hypothetical protein